jgi:CheY-like chemotaxis protein
MSAGRILYVHEEIAGLDDLLGTLVLEGYDVVPVVDGAKALDLLSSEEVDGVVLDYDMEAPDGRTLRTQISHRCPDMPILLFREGKELSQLPLAVFRAYLRHPEPPDLVLAHLN